MSVFSRFRAFTKRHPIVRGILSYGTIWPTSCIIQQTIAGKTWDNYDWKQALRFSLYGGLFTAPTLYGWIKISSMMWPGATLQVAITKALVEQVTYGPAAMCCFFFAMNYMNTYNVDEAIEEVKMKFFPTYKVGICVWPVLQTINFLYIKERNRVPYVSMCSLVWCCFLAYMHELKTREKLLATTSPQIQQQKLTL
ncbi:mpv17-like protein [Onthophagus taurus]|uniref:mpv17-like protein n=1 Tax=Onthophagus taurus TaxID=166361 RepID=UPI000C201DB8|nr:mpv17-like protein [Onthophagus taurus]